MAASANPSESSSSAQKVPSSSPTTANGGGSTVHKNKNNNNSDISQTQAALRHSPGISAEWTPEEQSKLEDLLIKYGSESSIARYAKIAVKLKDKTVRDVALRCRWMNKKENGKRRKDDHSARKNKDRKEKAIDSSAKPASYLTPRPNGPSYAPPMIPLDNDDGISFKAIGGVIGELLEQNAQVFNQVSSNFGAYQMHENISLLSKVRDNIYTILNDLNDLPEVMRQMPPLPVKVNDELASSILLRPSHRMKS